MSSFVTIVTFNKEFTLAGKFVIMIRSMLLVVILALPLYAAAQEGDDRGYLVKVGDVAPDFILKMTDGSSVALKELRGKVVMLQFTASWCGVCRKEMPHIEEEIWKIHKNKDFALFGIDRGEPLQTVADFARAMKITYPLALDEDESIFRLFAHPKAGVTRNVLIDKNGRIVFLTRLFDEKEFESLKDQIASLLR